jgi:hypothetical protein
MRVLWFVSGELNECWGFVETGFALCCFPWGFFVVGVFCKAEGSAFLLLTCLRLEG